MQERISPARRVSGSICLPGDKSISHRYAMLGAIARGVTRIRNFSSGADCRSTLEVIRGLGIEAAQHDSTVVIQGRSLDGLNAPASDLDAGNSGSTMRLLSGILAAQPFSSTMIGDGSLSRRPMDRIIQPLSSMGASISAREGRFPPLRLEGRPLHAIDYELPVPSAQVKSCILLAGLYAEGATVVREPLRSRDHTEIALREFGADVAIERRVIRLQGRPALAACELTVPSDLSSAAFFIVAALLLPESTLVIRGVGLNPTRSALLDFLISMGAEIRVLDIAQRNGELMGDILVRSSSLRGGTVEGQTTAALIDEIPALAVLGAAAGGLVVKDASELRIKETDRIATIAANLRRMGVELEETPDGMILPGRQKFHAAALDSFGDHRIAMAFSIAALAASGPCTIEGAEAAAVSFPEFFQLLSQVVES